MVCVGYGTPAVKGRAYQCGQCTAGMSVAAEAANIRVFVCCCCVVRCVSMLYKMVVCLHLDVLRSVVSAEHVWRMPGCDGILLQCAGNFSKCMSVCWR